MSEQAIGEGISYPGEGISYPLCSIHMWHWWVNKLSCLLVVKYKSYKF